MMTHNPAGSSPVGGPVRRAARWWLAAGTFVVGLLVGVVVAGLLITNAPDPGSAAGTPVTPDADGSSSVATTASPSDAGMEIVVNEACLRAINAAQDAYGAIERIAGAVTDLDFLELDTIVRELQPLQDALRNDVGDCRMSARLPDGSMVSTSAQPTTSAAEPDITVTQTPTAPTR